MIPAIFFLGFGLGGLFSYVWTYFVFYRPCQRRLDGIFDEHSRELCKLREMVEQ